MPRAALALIGLALAAGACATPVGGRLPACAPDLETTGVSVPESGVQQPRMVPIECYRVVRDARLEVVFVMPPGPDCHGVSLVDAVESADAVSIELRIGVLADPLAGACPADETRWAVPVELNRPIADRAVLDASRPAD